MNKNYFKYLILFVLFVFSKTINAQNSNLSGQVLSDGGTPEYAILSVLGTSLVATTDSTGLYTIDNIPTGQYLIELSSVGFEKITKTIVIGENGKHTLNFELSNHKNLLNEIVVSGTLKEMSKLESPINVETYSSTFLRKNPSTNLFDALQYINGIKPQINCNVCNTGEIKINGLDGSYTMILIDGMPVISSLASIYGLSGIPNSLIERVEIIKGPASSLYGSEAVGGLINIITKKTENAPHISIDINSTTWLEQNADIAFKLKVGKKTTCLTGLNYFRFNNLYDFNHDNFTDISILNKFSFFQKWNFERKNNRTFNIAARFFNEDRWGGDIRWNKQFRGSDLIYGESIYTNRFELIGNYQLPIKEKMELSVSLTNHNQDSQYGKTSYIAQDYTGFAQLKWNKNIKNHDILIGIATRYNHYNDNSSLTKTIDTSNNIFNSKHIIIPGLFIQHEIKIFEKLKMLAGLRYDYNFIHGNIYAPRIAYKLNLNDKNSLRLNAGTGYRIVNIFTEEHAALTGSRIIVIGDNLKPEKTYNVNFNYIKTIVTQKQLHLCLDFSIFYTYFNNKIISDFITDPNKIIFNNVNGFAESKGLTTNIDLLLNNNLNIIAGTTFMEVDETTNSVKRKLLFTEKFNGTWNISYKIKKIDLEFNYTGNVYSPVNLPLLSNADPRKEKSPWWSIQNIQIIYRGIKNFEIYGGVKNLLNQTIFNGNPFIISRSDDPFDKTIQFNNNGQVIANSNNPYGLTFDTTYSYGSNQGISGIMGLRLQIK